MMVRRGSFGGNKLRRCEVRPHLNPLPGGEEVATLPPFWIPAFAGMTNGGAGMTRSRNGGVQRRARKRRGRIFVRMTKWGAILREPPIFLPKTRVGVRTMKNTRQRTITLLSVRALDSA